MTSLSEVYEGQVGEYASLRRLYLGVGLFSLGAFLVISGIVVAATDLGVGTFGLTMAREYGGVLAGLGVPATFLGVFTVLPAGRRTQAAAVVGTGVAVLGVALFSHAYPCHWSGTNCGAGLANLTLPTVGVYFLGAITTFWCLFAGVANFKSRNDPGGTVSLEITREGETQVIEVPKSQLEDVQGAKGATGSVGGVGFLGSTPDGNVETQTNQRGAGDRAATDSTVSDGGASTNDITSLADDATVTRSVSSSTNSGSAGSPPTTDSPQSPSGPSASSPAAGGDSASEQRGGAAKPKNTGDAYCGSCGHFQYVRTENGMQPYCALHDDLMDDMEACDEWTPR
ncbi:DUF7139 domain-containing protein [Halobaculum sp. P14]|uniref:DUF7139 domain-containing protein n=1 Tax=Halobaculum sp. P14 TaxID=3421638 RepID=UPI003EB83754